jgi:phosphinothricin acetyltransferase
VTPTTLIRDVADGDMPAIQAIYAHDVLHGTASWELRPPDTAELTARRDQVLAAGYPYVVAEQDGQIAGYAYAGPYRFRPAYRFTVENSIYLHPDFHGQGIAQLLLHRVIDRCVADGRRQMIAVIGDRDSHASIRFHEKMGFRRVGTIDAIGWKFGRWLDSILMQRALGEGSESSPE